MAEEQNRNEEATAFKLKRARERGTVAKSPDMVAAAILLATVGCMYWVGQAGIEREVRLARAALGQAGRLDFSVASVHAFVARLLIEALHGLGPLLLTLVIVAVVANAAQTGPVFSFKPLAPDFDRINPVKGFERLFSMRVVYTAVKSLIKLALLGSVFVMALRHLLDPVLGLLDVDPAGYAPRLLELTASLAFKLALVILVAAIVDVAYTRWEFAKRMRMSRRELREEAKHREGDPRIRAKLRELRAEMLKRSRALRKLPSADVLVTNPTHLAVAIRYRHREMRAPQLVAKGAGGLVKKMRETAGREGIPVVQNPPLARSLFHEVDYDEYVPERFYGQLLKILVWVYAMRQAPAREAGPA